jgi:16S rRNA (cytidine1402-2'-O)-methyltransferase
VILEDVALVVADDVDYARRLLAQYGIATPPGTSTPVDIPLEVLAANEVALVSPGRAPGLSEASERLVRAAIERGFAVSPVPGPTLALTALVISGLPANSFVYLGELPHEPSARHDLLAPVAKERRTLVACSSYDRLAEILADLHGVLDDRPLALVASSSQGARETWRGTVGEAAAHVSGQPTEGPCILVIGGAREETTRWDEGQVRAQIQAQLDQGLGAKEISKHLTVESGWPRRQIYRMVVETARFSPDD